MSALFLALLAVMLIGWTSATSLARVRRDNTDNTTDEQDGPEIREYFKGVSEILRKALGRPSEETARRVAEYDPNTDPRNPEELGTYYEGDILLPVDESTGRSGLVANSSRWPNGRVPFEIEMDFDRESYKTILRAIMIYNSQIPCVRFVPRTRERNYVLILNDEGCYSSVGRAGGSQILSLQSPGCTFKIGTVLHELKHALGFLHEHTREDRDDYVDIHFENVQEGTENNFKKDQPGKTISFGVNYTYSSVMHYSRNAFSKNGKPTVVPTPDPDVVIGQREGLDPNDIIQIRAMYGCPARD